MRLAHTQLAVPPTFQAVRKKLPLNPWAGLSGLPADAWVVATATLINRAGTVVFPFLALYLSERFRFRDIEVGRILSVFGIGAIVSGPISGKLSDKLGAMRIMKLSLLLSSVALFLFPTARSFASIIVITFLWALISESFR